MEKKKSRREEDLAVDSIINRTLLFNHTVGRGNPQKGEGDERGVFPRFNCGKRKY